jgi:hypothetical protein
LKIKNKIGESGATTAALLSRVTMATWQAARAQRKRTRNSSKNKQLREFPPPELDTVGSLENQIAASKPQNEKMARVSSSRTRYSSFTNQIEASKLKNNKWRQFPPPELGYGSL